MLLFCLPFKRHIDEVSFFPAIPELNIECPGGRLDSVGCLKHNGSHSLSNGIIKDHLLGGLLCACVCACVCVWVCVGGRGVGGDISGYYCLEVLRHNGANIHLNKIISFPGIFFSPLFAASLQKSAWFLRSANWSRV